MPSAISRIGTTKHEITTFCLSKKVAELTWLSTHHCRWELYVHFLLGHCVCCVCLFCAAVTSDARSRLGWYTCMRSRRSCCLCCDRVRSMLMRWLNRWWLIGIVGAFLGRLETLEEHRQWLYMETEYQKALLTFYAECYVRIRPMAKKSLCRLFVAIEYNGRNFMAFFRICCVADSNELCMLFW